MRESNSVRGEGKSVSPTGALFTKLYTVFFLFMIFSICIAWLAPKAASFVPERNNSENTGSAAEFPVEENTRSRVLAGQAAQKQNLLGTALARARGAVSQFRGIKSSIEKAVKDQHPLRMPFVLLNRTWSRYICGMNMTTALSGTELSENENVVAVRSDGMLTYIMDDVDVTGTAWALIDFAKEMEEQGRFFLLFEPLIKTGNLDAQYRAVVTDYAAQRDAQVNALLSENGVNYVSCTEKAQQEGLEDTQLFFKTDHHWLPQAGIWACGVLAEALNGAAGYEIDAGVFDGSNYEITWLPDFFLGSQGRKVTEVYAPPEDFPIILPKYESDLTVFHSVLNRTLSGSIRDTMFDWNVLEETDLYSRNAYGLYGYGDEGLTRIHNNDLPDGRRVLFIKVSLADCMAPYLSNIAEYVDLIDLRAFGGSLRSYIRETDPDAVVVIYPTSTFEAKNSAIYDFS